MIILNTWQLILAVVMIFLFGWGTGRTMGESRAWAKMDRQEEASPELFHNMEQAFGNVMYKTEGSTILTVRIGQYDDERHEDYLMKTPNGRYFHQSHQRFTGGSQYDYIHPYTKEEAMRDYNHTPDKRVSFEEAFGEGLIEA